MQCDCGEEMNNYLWNGDIRNTGNLIEYAEEWKCETCNKWKIIYRKYEKTNQEN